MMGSWLFPTNKAFVVLFVFLSSCLSVLSIGGQDNLVEDFKRALRRIPAFKDQPIDEIKSFKQVISPPRRFRRRRRRGIRGNKNSGRKVQNGNDRTLQEADDIECGDLFEDHNIELTLNADLECDCTLGSPLTLNGTGITLDLNGHNISCIQFVFLLPCINVFGSGSIIRDGNLNNCFFGATLQGSGNHLVQNVNMLEGNILGVSSTQFSFNNQILENNIVNASFNGITVWERATVKDNNILSTTGYGLQVLGDNNIVIGNDIIDTKDPDPDNAGPQGVGILCQNGVGNEINENNVTNSETVGIRLRDCDSNFIKRNLVSSSGNEGIIVGDGPTGNDSTANRVNRNTLTSNGGPAIVDETIARGSSRNRFRRNIFNGNNPDAIVNRA